MHVSSPTDSFSTPDAPGFGTLAGLLADRTPEQLRLLLVGFAQILEAIAEGRALSELLDELMRILEQQVLGMVCTVQLLSEDGRHIRHGAAPSLPESFSRAFEGAAIGPRAGSCGTAAFWRRQVIVRDIEHDPLWDGWRDLALQSGLRACWSTPILSRDGRVLGTFAMYFHEPAVPSRLHLNLIELATHLARVAIEQELMRRERQQAEAALRRASHALELSNQQKDHFMAMLAHELRNPLAAIANALSVVRLRWTRSEPVDQPLKVAEREVRNSARLLDDLLDVAMLTQGKVQLRKEPTDLGEVVLAAIECQRPFIEARRHRLRVSLPDEPLVVDGDPTRLEQVVSNLLNNAAKYSPEGGEITVRLERSGAEARLTVRDRGVGIPPDLLPRIFDLFVQADRSLARTGGGLGLGLPLVSKLLSLHGGGVEAHSAGPGEGSEFVVHLPRVEEASPSVPPPLPRTATAEPRRILLVEDNQDAALLLAEVLGAEGHQVAVAHDGPSALRLAPSFRPELALIDIGLPGMDGYEVARQLRQLGQERAPVLVALSGYGQAEDRRRSREAGMAAHLTKPCDPELLQRTIQNLVSARPPAQ